MKKANLDSIVNPQEKFVEDQDLTDYIDGDISNDTDEKYFRIYPNPLNRKFYYRCSRESCKELEEWSSEELLNSEFYGQRRFRIRINYGDIVQRVEVYSVVVGTDPLITKSIECGKECSASGQCVTSSSNTAGCRITSSGICVSTPDSPHCR